MKVNLKTNIAVLLLVCAVNIPSYAMSYGDVDTLVSKALAISNSDLDSSGVLIKKAWTLAKRNKNISAYAYCDIAMGKIYMDHGENDSAIRYYREAGAIYHFMHDKKEVQAAIGMASAYLNLNSYENALECITNALNLTTLSENDIDYARALKTAGVIYRKLGFNDKAKESIRKAVAIFAQTDSVQLLANAISSLGSVYLVTNSFDSANICYQSALSTFLKTGNRRGIALTFENLGVLANVRSGHLNNYWLDTAYKYYTKAYNIFDSIKDKESTSFEKMALADILIRKKRYDPAEKYLRDAAGYFEAKRDYTNYGTALGILADIYDSTHQYEQAYRLQYKITSLAESTVTQNMSKRLAESLANYEAEKKNRTITLLNAQKQLAEHQLAKRRLIELFSMILLLLAIALTMVLMNRYRIKQRLQQMVMRNQIANDLHDDVGSSLSSILLLSKIAARPNADKGEILDKITGTAQEVIEKIGDIVWATNPKYDEGESLHEKIINYVVKLAETSGIDIRYNISDTIDEVRFPMETRKNIFLVIKEALHNIMKHAGASEIAISLSVQNKTLLLKIADNGKGFDTTSHNKGNGLNTMRSRIQLVGGTIDYYSSVGKGTTISVAVPV